MSNDFAADISARARWARDHNDSWPKDAWSTGEKFAVALVLDKITAIAEMGYSRADAVERLAGDIGGTLADAEAWIEQVRGTL